MGLKNINYWKVMEEKVLLIPSRKYLNVGIKIEKRQGGRIKLIRSNDGGTIYCEITPSFVKELNNAIKEMKKLEWTKEE